MKKKILIIVENPPVPSIDAFGKKLVQQVTVLCPRAKGYMDKHLVLQGINIYNIQ